MRTYDRAKLIEKTVSPELAEGTGFIDSAEFLFSSGASIEDERLVKEENGREPLSWAEYFGLEAVTVTKTLVHSVTAKYHDPNTIIVYDVKGCRPTHLPFNLPFCSSAINSSNIDNNTTATPHSISILHKQVHYVP